MCLLYWELWTDDRENESRGKLVSSGGLSGSSSDRSDKTTEKFKPDSEEPQNKVEINLWFEVLEARE
jgi:hypothetical protein